MLTPGSPFEKAKDVRVIEGEVLLGAGAVVEAIQPNPLEFNVDVYNGNHEPILNSCQLLAGVAGGLLQAMTAYIAVQPNAATDTFVITDGVVTETWTFKAARVAPFDVAIGADAAAAQTNLIAAIVADSTLWSALAVDGLGQFFAGKPASQFIVYRKAVSTNNDRIYGLQTNPAGIKVVAFSSAGYSLQNATESNIPDADPGAKRFGFGRAVSSLSFSEKHYATEEGLTYVYNSSTYSWNTYYDTDDLRPQMQLGSGCVLAIGVAAVRSPQLAKGRYRLSGNGDVWFLQGNSSVTATNAAGAVAGATPGYLSAGSIDMIRVTNPASNGYLSVIQDLDQIGYISVTKML